MGAAVKPIFCKECKHFLLIEQGSLTNHICLEKAGKMVKVEIPPTPVSEGDFLMKRIEWEDCYTKNHRNGCKSFTKRDEKTNDRTDVITDMV